LNSRLINISEKVYKDERLTSEEALCLYEEGELGFLGTLANHAREKKQNNKAYYIRNFHLEPSNICVYNCRFCSYSSRYSGTGWDYSIEDIKEQLKKYNKKDIREIHITGSANPSREMEYYIELLREVKADFPKALIKAFSAVEIHYIAEKANKEYKEVLILLKEGGLDALPGGGAEIFDEGVRKKICPDKVSSDNWLKIHETAHKLGISTNATMLYGHIESYSHRVNHLERLRKLQDETGGFGAFIPLKFKSRNNEMTGIRESSAIDDLKNYAVSRIYLDNFQHIKAYWPMLGKQMTQVALSFGVDDIDGTIEDSTKIYSSAGAEEKNPGMTVEEMIEMIRGANREPVER
jgi:aminodeoxyfutalosine synthase